MESAMNQHGEPLLVKALIRVGDHMRRHFRTVVADHDLNMVQAAVLRHLDEPSSMSAIAEVQCIDASYVTGLVDRLEELGYVERQADPADRRIRNVAITPAGRKVRDAIRSSIADSAEPFERLTAKEQGQLLQLLDKAFPK